VPASIATLDGYALGTSESSGNASSYPLSDSMRKTPKSGEYVAICTNAAITSFDVQSDSTLHLFDASDTRVTSQAVGGVLSTSKPTPGQAGNYDSDAAINLFCPLVVPAADEEGISVTIIALAGSLGAIVLFAAIAYCVSGSSTPKTLGGSESNVASAFIF